MSSVLTLSNVTRSYVQAGKTLHVLNGVNLEIAAGEVVALVGPSGSGKTTLLQIAGLLDAPTSGTISCGARSVGAGSQPDAAQDLAQPLSPSATASSQDKYRTLLRRSSIGFVYQFHHLLPEFSALENVMIPQMIAGVSRKASKEKANVLLASLGLSERVHHRPGALSGGEQQRVAIARALANDPKLLLADEPTGNLDPHTAEEVFSLLVKAAKERGLAALVATHNMELAKRMDRVVMLRDGVLTVL